MANNFQIRVKEALARYRVESLGIAEEGVWFKTRNTYPHILPAASFRENVLPSIRESFWQSSFARVKLHRDFHHLNSSQALCFNLFFPFLQQPEMFAHLLHALEIDELPGPGPTFEFEPTPSEGTSVDFLLPLASGARLLFEIKYTEQDFGVAKDDEKHRQKFTKVYQPKLDGRFNSKFRECNIFLRHYQILRNIWQLRHDKGDTVVFLIPRTNECLQKRTQVLSECIDASYQGRVRLVYLEDLLAKLIALAPRDSTMAIAMNEFRSKYLPSSVTGT